MRKSRLVLGLLSFVMLANAIVLPKTTTFAAPNVEIFPVMNKGLSYGSTNPTPTTINGNEVPPEMVFLQWDLAASLREEYQLQYPIDDYKKAIVTVNKNNYVADVSYDVYHWNGAAWENVRELAYSKGYEVHTNVGSSGGQNFVPVSTYLGAYNGSDPDYHVHPNDPRDPSYIIKPDYSNLTPAFTLVKGLGYSFIYDGKIVHVKWDEMEDSMFFATEALEDGRAYTFDFIHRANSADPWTPSIKNPKNVITGFSTSSSDFEIIPKANNGKAVADELDLTTTPAIDEPPGSPDLGLKLKFTIPYGWDDALKSFSALPVISSPMPLEINLVNNDPTKSIQIIINDLLASGAMSYSITPDSASGGPEVLGITRAGNTVEVELDKLDSGQIYDTYMEIIGSAQVKAKPTSLPYGSVFSFLEYEVIQQDGRLYAAITPYEGVEGDYMLLQGSALNKSVVKWFDGGASKTILMPLNISPESGAYTKLQVLFSPEKKFSDEDFDASSAIYSQIMKYKATTTNKASRPQFFYVSPGYTLTPTENDPTGNEAVLAMELNWDLGSKEAIDNMILASPAQSLELIYRLGKTTTPDDKSPNQLCDIKLTITPNAVTNIPDVYYSNVDLSKPRVVNLNMESLGVFGGANPLEPEGRYVAKVIIEVPVAHVNNEDIATVSAADFLYPGIYFLNATPILQNGVDPLAGASLYDSITLNDISKLEAPPPQNLEITDVTTTAASPQDPTAIDETSFSLEWSTPVKDIEEFLEHSYGMNPATADVKMNLYLSQNKDFMTKKFSAYNGDLWGERQVGEMISYVPFPVGSQHLYLSQTNTNPPILGTTDTIGADTYAAPLDALRSGKVLQIGDIPLDLSAPQGGQLKLDGLDKNQKYYICADIVITQKHSTDPSKDQTDASFLTPLLGVTTKGDKDLPTGLDKVPVAPEVNVKEDSVSLDTATISWNKIYISDPSETIEYEILRLDQKQMSLEQLNNRTLSFNQLWTEKELEDVRKVGFRTKDSSNILGAALMSYDGELFASLADPLKYTLETQPDSLYLKDMSLEANQLYFYYVRTVKTDKDGNEINSVWNYVTVTTPSLEAPENLEALTNRQDYDPQREIWIGFNSQISQLEGIGEIYDFQYQLKAGEDKWSETVTMDANNLKEGATALESGGHAFVYKIGGLSQGTGYAVKIRMVDAKGNVSTFTPSLSFRTDINQEVYEKQESTKDMTAAAEETLGGLLKTPFWVSKDDENAFEAIARPTMWGEVTAKTADRQILLPAGSFNAKTMTYYLPLSLYENANAQNMGFAIKTLDYEVIIPPNFMSQENDRLIKISSDLENYKIKDCFIKISVGLTNPDIEKASAASGVTLDIDAVGTKEDVKAWDDNLYAELSAEITDYMSENDFAETVEQVYDHEITKQDLSRLILKEISLASQELSKTTEDEKNALVKRNYPLTAYDKAITLISKDTSQAYLVTGQQNAQGKWEPLEVISHENGRYMSVTKDGEYAFVSTEPRVIGADYKSQEQKAKALISKYDLDGVFGKDIVNLDQKLTVKAAVDTLEKMSQKPIGFYEGLPFSKNTDLNQEVTVEEAVFLVMELYGEKTNTDVATLKIHDYNAVPYLSQSSPPYAQSLRAAHELGLYQTFDLRPNDNISLQAFLTMLSVLDDIVTSP